MHVYGLMVMLDDLSGLSSLNDSMTALIHFFPPKEKPKQTEDSHLTLTPQKQKVFKEHLVNDIKC